MTYDGHIKQLENKPGNGKSTKFVLITKVNFVMLTKMAPNSRFWRHMQTKNNLSFV